MQEQRLAQINEAALFAAGVWTIEKRKHPFRFGRWTKVKASSGVLFICFS